MKVSWYCNIEKNQNSIITGSTCNKTDFLVYIGNESFDLCERLAKIS